MFSLLLPSVPYVTFREGLEITFIISLFSLFFTVSQMEQIQMEMEQQRRAGGGNNYA